MIPHHLAAKLFTPGIERFRDRHKGETCYLFGDGPSIKWMDLGQFTRYPAISCGFVPFHLDFHKLDFRYATLVEPWLFTPKFLQPDALHCLRCMVREYADIIRRSPDQDFFVSLSNRFSLVEPNVHYVYRGVPVLRNAVDRALSQTDLWGGSFHASLSLAHYMGFTTIYMVGFDTWTLQPIRNLRWYEFGPGQQFDNKPELARDFLDLIRQQADVYTIGLEGKSGNVKYVDYREHTGAEPQYRENAEIMAAKHLRMMARCPRYSIFPGDDDVRASYPEC